MSDRYVTGASALATTAEPRTAGLSDERSPFAQRRMVARYAAEQPPGPPGGDPGRLSKNLGALAGGQVVTWTVTLIWTLIVPRVLGPQGLGMLVTAQSVTGILGMFIGFGAGTYLVREIVMSDNRAPRLVGTAIILRLALAPIVFAAAVVWGRVAHYGHDATVVLYLIMGMTIFTLLTEPIQAGFQAIERMQYQAYGNTVNKAGQSFIGIALVIIGFRTVGIAASMAIVVGAVLVLQAVWLKRFIRIDVRTNARLMARMAKQSAPYLAIAVVALIYFWIDAIMLSLMTDAQVVGWYGAASALFQTLMFLPGIVSGPWLPRLVRAFAQGGSPLLAKTARAPMEFVLVASIPIATGTIMVAHVLIRAVYGASFQGAVPAMVVLAFCIPAIYVNMMLNQVLVAAKRQVVWTYVMVGAAIVNPLFNLILIPATQARYHNGAIGAALSLLLTELLMDGVGFLLVGRRVLDRASLRRCALAVLASAGMWSVAYGARTLGELVALAAGVGTFVILTLTLRVVTPEEVAVIRSGVARVRARAAR